MKLNAYKIGELAQKEKLHRHTIKNKIKKGEIIAITHNVGKQRRTRFLDIITSRTIMSHKDIELLDCFDNDLI